MKNVLVQFALASTLVVTAVAASSSAYAQQAGGNAGGRGAGAGGGGGHVAIKAFNPTFRYRQTKNNCECTIRQSTRNGSAATYKVCKKAVQLRDGSYVNRTCSPTG